MDALKINPNSIPANRLAGKAYILAKQPQNAVKFLEKAISLSPKVADIHKDMAMAYFSLSRFDKSIEAYQKTLEITPSDLVVRMDLSSLLIKEDRYHEAEQHLLVLLKKEPNNKQALINYSYIQRQLLQHQKSVEIYKTKLCPQYPEEQDIRKNLVRTLDYAPGLDLKESFNEFAF